MEVRPTMGQIDDLLGEINARVERTNGPLSQPLTKKMAEDLTDYFKEMGVKVKYMHSDIKTLERTEIIRDLRLGVFDVLVGINLPREESTFPRLVWWQSLMQIRKVSFVTNAVLSRLLAGRTATARGMLSCMRTL